ncbi:hypothetical protein HHL21_11170 [Massilia sp. RP-1-19]|uniref:Uncharacterized protein n=1 Tax=Massilia polaris TaxID=2728846 RepID=A0A848HN85_9BURK|nr:hypothetical protein [Massilia polaris]NML61630.1 hypothetical protein [Massilia polaris]
MNIDRQQDMREFNGDLWEVEARQRASRTFQQAVEVTAAVGVLTGLNALAYYVFRQTEVDLWGADRFILALAWMGFELATIAALFLYFKKQSNVVRQERRRYLAIASEFLAQWTRFEILGQSKLKSMAIEVYPWSVREIIRTLVSVNAMGADDMAMVEEALRTRDVLVHVRAQIDAADLTRISDRLRELATRLDSK